MTIRRIQFSIPAMLEGQRRAREARLLAASREPERSADPAIALYRAEKALRANPDAEKLQAAAKAFDEQYAYWRSHRSARMPQPNGTRKRGAA